MTNHYTMFDKNGEVIAKYSNHNAARTDYDIFYANGLESWIEDENGKIILGKKPIKTIDITLTWANILPVLLVAYTEGTETGRALALSELQRMAKIADSK